MLKNIKPIPVELVKIQVEFRARMAYEKEHEVKWDVEEKVKIHHKNSAGMASKNAKENLSWIRIRWKWAST